MFLVNNMKRAHKVVGIILIILVILFLILLYIEKNTCCECPSDSDGNHIDSCCSCLLGR